MISFGAEYVSTENDMQSVSETESELDSTASLWYPTETALFTGFTGKTILCNS
jgi:hypothetical protein